MPVTVGATWAQFQWQARAEAQRQWLRLGLSLRVVPGPSPLSQPQAEAQPVGGPGRPRPGPGSGRVPRADCRRMTRARRTVRPQCPRARQLTSLRAPAGADPGPRPTVRVYSLPGRTPSGRARADPGTGAPVCVCKGKRVCVGRRPALSVCVPAAAGGTAGDGKAADAPRCRGGRRTAADEIAGAVRAPVPGSRRLACFTTLRHRR